MKKLLILCLMVIFTGCSSSDSEATVAPTTTGQDPVNQPGENGEQGSSDASWSIPVDEVYDGGPGKDGIPALIDPHFTTADTYLEDSDLVIGFKSGNVVRAYPHIVLDWHEIVNDKLLEEAIAITYCPLTGTGIGWNRNINRAETTFGVSGLLYNTNLIPYDRATGSNWSQILNECVNGELKGQKIAFYSMVETNWGTWKKLYPETEVLSLNTGFSRPYGTSPYGDYATNNDRFLFPVAKDERLPLKERVHAITFEDQARVYRFVHFGPGNNIIRENIAGTEYLIVGNQDFIVSYALDVTQTELDFKYVLENSNILLTDQENNKWDVFGVAVEGPRTGETFGNARSFMGYWFSIPAFYETSIYGN